MEPNYKKGEIYTGVDGKDRYIWKCAKSDSMFVSCYLLITRRRTTFTIYDGENSWGNQRLATTEEKEHLEQCIAAGKYVDYKPQNLSYEYSIF